MSSWTSSFPLHSGMQLQEEQPVRKLQRRILMKSLANKKCQLMSVLARSRNTNGSLKQKRHLSNNTRLSKQWLLSDPLLNSEEDLVAVVVCRQYIKRRSINQSTDQSVP